MRGMATFGQQVREAREARGWSQEQLAEAVGTTQSTIDRVESGASLRSRFGPEIAALLGLGWNLKGGATPRIVSADDAARPLPSEGDIPLHAAVEGGPGELLIEREPIDFIARPDRLAGVPDAYAVYVVGDSMVPEFEPGDIAFVHPRLPLVPNAACVFYTLDGENDRAAIKRLVKQTQQLWTVQQWNPAKTFDLDRRKWPRAHRVDVSYKRR